MKGVFHCFGGTVEEAKRIMELGFYMGIGGVLTFKKSGLDEVLRQIGLEKVVLETDAPYLAPVPYRGKRNEPSYIPIIADKLAEVMQISVEEIANITTRNAKNLFGL
nr:TatD family hydrolase [Niabella ginsengisoli]